MEQQLDKKSILEMAGGAILERVDYEMGKVIDNIMDPKGRFLCCLLGRMCLLPLLSALLAADLCVLCLRSE